MTREELFSLQIERADEKFFQAAMKRWDSLSKPIDGLGDFERAIAQIAAIQRTVDPVVLRKTVLIMCADNGIVEEGVSQSSQEATKSVAISLGRGISSASTLARACGAQITAVDIGIACAEKIEGILDCKVAYGTGNFLKGPATTQEETLRAIETGMELAKKSQADVLASGEMGIGNTTTSTLLLCYLLGLDPAEYTGRGAGLDDLGLKRKTVVIEKGLDLLTEKMNEKSITKGSGEEALLALELIGGLEIAGLVGVFLGAAASRKPVVIDGVISAAAAVIAVRIAPAVRDYLLASHEGRESALIPALSYLKCRPYIRGNMALGEGTGAILLFPLLDAVSLFYHHAASFEQVQIEPYRRFES